MILHLSVRRSCVIMKAVRRKPGLGWECDWGPGVTMRTFQRGEDRFWTIDRKSLSITVSFGKVGGKPQTRKTVSKREATARQLYQRMIRDKLRDGYVETTPPPAPLAATGKALESALVENPDDVAAHMALADWLSEQPEPTLQTRGEFIRVQLALENPKLPAGERNKLQKREKLLRKTCERDWLGQRMCDYLFDGGGDDLFVSYMGTRDIPREYHRGWLSRLTAPVLTQGLATVLADAPCLRLLRELNVEFTTDFGDIFAPFAKSTNLSNVRRLKIEAFDPEGQASDLIASLPRIEEIYLLGVGVEPGPLFALRNLENLRVLHMVEANHYSIRELAVNPSLKRLEELVLSPPGLQEDEEPHLRLASVRALLRSKLLPSLRTLALHRSDMGDAGCREVADSGVLARLTTLDLTLGCVTDEGRAFSPAAKTLPT